MEIMDTDIILKTNFHDIKLVKRGKVRDVYEIGEYFLIVSTDRLSAFDVIMSQGIPDKGKVLTKISEFWFNETRNIVRNHVVTTVIDEFPEVCQKYRDQLQGRSMIVKKAKVIPIECIVRGYISGSGWNDYKKTGKISGIDLPNGLKESEKLPEPLFTPSTKAEIGTHDENISFDQAEKIIDKETLKEVKKAALDIYKTSSNLALKKGIISADTKMEFGLIDGEVILVDELLTPDSSRFWPENNYKVGQAQQSYDKQFVRDYLLSINFNKQPPPPILPEDIIQKTRKKYLDVLYKLTGERLT
jgi:phosphoribosylaminoimidazole-succinocarboxamide synthase